MNERSPSSRWRRSQRFLLQSTHILLKIRLPVYEIQHLRRLNGKLWAGLVITQHVHLLQQGLGFVVLAQMVVGFGDLQEGVKGVRMVETFGLFAHDSHLGVVADDFV